MNYFGNKNCHPANFKIAPPNSKTERPRRSCATARCVGGGRQRRGTAACRNCSVRGAAEPASHGRGSSSGRTMGSTAGMALRRLAQVERPLARFLATQAADKQPRKTCLYDLHVDNNGELTERADRRQWREIRFDGAWDCWVVRGWV